MSENRKREKILYVRVSFAEWLEITKKAETAGLNIASYIRYIVLEKSISATSSSPPLDRVLLGQLIGLLGEIFSKLRTDEATAISNCKSVEELLAKMCDILHQLRELVLTAIGRLDNDNKWEKAKKC